MKANIFSVMTLALLASCAQQGEQATPQVSEQEHEVIQLYEGAAPGSESWDWDETVYYGENKVYYGMTADVSHPSITVYRPEKPNGVALIVCPGGAFAFLCMDREGEDISKVYNSKGITCFVLKYRLYHVDDKDAFLRDLYSGETNHNEGLAKVIPLAIQDAAAAISYVRSHADDYGIDPNKIGISGSSAGGCITMGTSMTVRDESCHPNFAVATYPFFAPGMFTEVPSDYPLPLYIAVARDDTTVPVSHSLDLYKLWIENNQQAEMHIYNKGEHGFVGNKQGLAVDNWTDNLFLWLKDIYPENFKDTL